MTNFFALLPNFQHSQTFSFLIGLLKLHVAIIKFGVNLNYFTFCLTDNLTMTNFLLYPLAFSLA